MGIVGRRFDWFHLYVSLTGFWLGLAKLGGSKSLLAMAYLDCAGFPGMSAVPVAGLPAMAMYRAFRFAGYISIVVAMAFIGFALTASHMEQPARSDTK